MVNLYIYGLLGCLLAQCQAEKIIYFSQVKCTATSGKISNVSCFLEDNTKIAFQTIIGDHDLGNVVGIVRYNFAKTGVNTITVVNGLRLEICKMLSGSIRPSVLNFLYRGILDADNNFPGRCPFRRNCSYELRHLKFDANNLPICLPENNFTITAKFFANNAPIFNVQVVGRLSDNKL